VLCTCVLLIEYYKPTHFSCTRSSDDFDVSVKLTVVVFDYWEWP